MSQPFRTANQVMAITGSRVSSSACRTPRGALTLPFDMGILGATGCTLYASADALVPIKNHDGTGVLVLPIPANADLVEFPFFCQAMFNDPIANKLGIVMSNGLAGVIGNQ